MDAMLGGGGDINRGQFPLEQWFYEMPVCTRLWTLATVMTSVLVQCHVITPFQLFYSFRAVYYKSQVSSVLIAHIQNTTKAKTTPDLTDANFCALVLATRNLVFLLWTAKPRPRLPRLLSPTLLTSA